MLFTSLIHFNTLLDVLGADMIIRWLYWLSKIYYLKWSHLSDCFLNAVAETFRDECVPYTPFLLCGSGIFSFFFNLSIRQKSFNDLSGLGRLWLFCALWGIASGEYHVGDFMASWFPCVCMCICACVCSYVRGRGRDFVSQVLSTFLFETGPLTHLELTSRLCSLASKPQESTNPPFPSAKITAFTNVPFKEMCVLSVEPILVLLLAKDCQPSHPPASC